MIGSPAVITPPTVFAIDWKTAPSCGARMSVRLSWSSAVTLRSTNSPILPGPWHQREVVASALNGGLVAEMLL
jgi:hypothetical protein